MDSRDETARIRLPVPEQDCQDRTGRTRLPGQDCQDREGSQDRASEGQPGQDFIRIARTRLYKDSQEGKGWTGHITGQQGRYDQGRTTGIRHL